MKYAPYTILLILSILTLSGCDRHDEPDPGSSRIIVLMYHRIVDGEASNLYERSLSDFENDIRYLIKNNIDIISLDDIDSLKRSGLRPERNAAVLTFDDGDRSWFTVVRPIIMKYKIEATLFLWTSMIGKDSFLTWEEVSYMSNYMLPGGTRPFRFGSHTFSHPFLHEKKSSFTDENEYNLFLDYELRESKKIIEMHVPLTVNQLALPYGDGAGDSEIIAAAQRNGYEFVRTSNHSSIDNIEDLDLFMIPALPILDDTSPEEIGYYLGI